MIRMSSKIVWQLHNESRIICPAYKMWDDYVMETQTLPMWLEARQVLTAQSGHHDGKDGTSSRNLYVGDRVNDTGSEGVVRVFGPGFTEQLGCLVSL